MVVALRVLAMREEALRDHQMEIVLGARHCDIEEAPLFLDLFRSAGAEVRRNASIDDIQYEDRLPFLALGGMDGRKDQIILVEQRHTGLDAASGVAPGQGQVPPAIPVPIRRRWDTSERIRFALDSPLEGGGFEPSVPRQGKWSMPSSS